MTMLDSITVRCGLCGTETDFSDILSTSSVGSSDLDTRSPAMHGWVLDSQVQRCSGCGYCASDVGVVSPDAQAIIKGQEYRDQLTDPSYPELANSFLCKAILDRESKDFSVATWTSIMAAWVCDDADCGWQAMACRNKAVDTLMLAEMHNQQISKQDGMNVAILVDLLRRSNQVEQAREIIAARRGRITDDLIKRILDYQNDLLDKNDFSRHTIEEALSHIRKHDLKVVASHKLDVVTSAQQDLRNDTSYGSSVGESDALPKFRVHHKSSEKVPLKSGSSMRADAIDTPEKVTKIPVMSTTILDDLKAHPKESLVIYVVTVVIAAVGIGLGGEGSPIKPPFSFLFAIPGGVAFFVALWLTFINARIFAPILIERSPASVRPLCALTLFLIWASIPLWPSYFNTRAFSLNALLDYFEFHGIFVAKLFVVGIIAFLFGLKSGYERVLAYISIPVASMLLGFLLSPDSDPAAEATGLKAGLVYYIGVLFAASIGYFIGEVTNRIKKLQ